MQKTQKSLILVVDENNLCKVETSDSGSFEDLKIWERKHIQEWIIKKPDILGEPLLIITSEFDRFVESNDRLDLLALDKSGNLVVIELKRDGFGGYADLQAIRYAAMISAMTIEDVTGVFTKFYNRSNITSPIDEVKAEQTIKEFVNNDFKEFSNKPRIILCSENFSTELTTTVLWLRDFEVDISCVRIRPHKIGDKVVVIPTLIIPLPEAEEYQTNLQRKEDLRFTERSERTKRPTSVRLLLERGYLNAGDILSVVREKLPSYLLEYYDTRPTEFYQAEITGKSGKANNLKWLHDGQEYSISNLSTCIFTDIHPEHQHPGPLAGPDYWTNGNGKTLYEWANEIWEKKLLNK